MAREIGSEFWDVPETEKQNGLFPESTQWYLSGRSALQAIIAELGESRSVSLPSWCCDSMIKPFLDAGLDVHFYPVYWQEGLIQEINLDSDVLFLMDYFGYTGRQIDLSGYKGIVIRDVTHSLFSTTYDDGDYFFGSLRKWCGVWTGGYAWTKDGHRLNVGTADESQYTALRKKAMRQKAEYICEEREDKGFLIIFLPDFCSIRTRDIIIGINLLYIIYSAISLKRLRINRHIVKMLTGFIPFIIFFFACTTVYYLTDGANREACDAINCCIKCHIGAEHFMPSKSSLIRLCLSIQLLTCKLYAQM